MKHAALIALIAATPSAANAVELHCLGRDPFFMMVLNTDTATFNYLGDGVFELDPALSAPLGDFEQTALMTAGGPVPVFLERRECTSMMGVSLPFAIEVGIPAFAGQRPANGCCRDATPQE
jgi:hypothetical protein